MDEAKYPFGKEEKVDKIIYIAHLVFLSLNIKKLGNRVAFKQTMKVLEEWIITW